MKLKSLLVTIIFAAVTAAPNAVADTKIHVVATTPDLAYFTRRIGGDLVEVKSLATGVEDPHSVPMKPSFAVLLNRADILVLQGLGLDHAFLPGLLDAARNPKLLPGQPAYIDCSKYVLPLDVPTRVDRSLGEQHLLGNPHFNLDPVNGRNIIRAISEGLAQNYPEDAAQFQANSAALLAELDGWIARWKIEAAPFKGVKFVSFHPDLAYLAERYGLVQVGTIEEKPGVDPTPGHINELIQLMIRENVRLVIRERHFPAQLASTIAEKTGARVAEVVIMTGGVPEAQDYFGFINYNLHSILAGIKEAP